MATLSQSSFGTTAAGEAVTKFTLKNSSGIELNLLSYGAAIQSLLVPDSVGVAHDVVLGFDTLAGYEKNSTYQGVTVGRVGNRIANGRFSLDGETFQLATNNGAHHLHGGPAGFHTKNWAASVVNDSTVAFEYVSADKEEGYPGTLAVKVTYELTPENKVSIQYLATTDKPTVVNLTNHSYFNLAGANSGDITGHEILSPISQYTPVDATLIPTGVLASVESTPFDFRQQTSIGARIADVENGYDHNLVVDRTNVAADGLAFVLRVVEPTSGRALEVLTTEPGIQLYTGGFLDGSVGKGGKANARFGGFCLETQHFPDSPNQPSFPSVVVRPGHAYTSQTVFSFPAPSGMRKAAGDEHHD